MKKILFISTLIFCIACQPKKDKKLPLYGISVVESPLGNDTIYKPVPNFEAYNQMGKKVQRADIKGKPFVVDFFFTSCPGICPKMARNMLKVYDKYTEELQFLSFSVDPKRDSIPKLNEYANKLGIENADTWQFLHTPKEEIKRITEAYMVLAYEDSTVAGGIEHGGQFILVDKNLMVRGYYNGIDDESVEQLINDVAILLEE